MAYMLISLLLFGVTAWVVPKRGNPLALYGTVLFGISVESMAEIFLDFKFNLFSYFGKGPEFGGMFVSYGLLPLFNVIYLSGFPFRKSLLTRFVYLMAALGFCMLYEWGARKFGLFYYNGWKWWYSALLECQALLLSAWFYSWFSKRLEKDRIKFTNPRSG